MAYFKAGSALLSLYCRNRLYEVILLVKIKI